MCNEHSEGNSQVKGSVEMALPSRSVYAETQPASTIAVVPTALSTARKRWLGREVGVYTHFYQWQVGEVTLVSHSPYVGDNRLMAFVVASDRNQFWSMWMPVDELVASCSCTDRGHEYAEELMCGECGHCLGCCDCPPPMQAHEDDSDGHFFVTDAWGFSREVDPDRKWDERG